MAGETTTADRAPLGLFEGFGVEIEHMLVDAGTLDVLPAADEILRDEAGSIVSDVERGEMAWSNELVLHVIEVKTNGPAPRLAGLAERFQAEARRIGAIAARRGARLLPTAMHPWMDPERETRLWPHDASPIYDAFDRIFGCRGHGWSNLQSVHLNLPFAGDEEFARLHAAVRLVLPILPALAASSPIVGGRATGILDNRMEFYRTNSARIPSVTGLVVPEPVFTRRDYEERILGAIYRDIAPHDPQGLLRDEFLNARGAIARFSRSTIEVRVIDVQECPLADLAILAALVGVLRLLVDEHTAPLSRQQAQATEPLAAILSACVARADRAVIDDAGYLGLLGIGERSLRAGELWARLIEEAFADDAAERDRWQRPLAHILSRGALARRILAALDGDLSRDRLAAVYRRLADCLERGELFQ